MKRIKIKFKTREDSRIVAEVMKQSEVFCFPDLTFVVPEPAIEVLDSLGAEYENLGEESWDRVVRALRSAASSTV
jgi:hypothetical protein